MTRLLTTMYYILAETDWQSDFFEKRLLIQCVHNIVLLGSCILEILCQFLSLVSKYPVHDKIYSHRMTTFSNSRIFYNCRRFGALRAGIVTQPTADTTFGSFVLLSFGQLTVFERMLFSTPSLRNLDKLRILMALPIYCGKNELINHQQLLWLSYLCTDDALGVRLFQ